MRLNNGNLMERVCQHPVDYYLRIHGSNRTPIQLIGALEEP